MKESVRKILLASGACAVGFAKAGSIDETADILYRNWIKEGNHGGMNYLERHIILRRNTDYILANAKTVISLAFSYASENYEKQSTPLIASYAYGEDYHIVIKEILQTLIVDLKKEFGGNWRICIDSAPVAERFWALKAGIGKLGRNGAVIVKDYGSKCFLAEILTTIEIEADKESTESCENCGKCVKACPTGALKEYAQIDSRQCLSYLTIEKKGDFDEKEIQIIKTLSEKDICIFGCDKCISVCPHNQNINNKTIDKFQPLAQIGNLTPEKILNMSEKEFSNIFKTSPLKRAKLQGLQRNIRLIECIKNQDTTNYNNR